MTSIFLQVFIYRGKEYERLSDFSSRTLNQLPNAELMNKLTPPGDDIMESPHQCILFLCVLNYVIHKNDYHI